jgi:hypothetical protein
MISDVIKQQEEPECSMLQISKVINFHHFKKFHIKNSDKTLRSRMALRISWDFASRAALTVFMICALMTGILYGHISIIIALAAIQIKPFKEIMELISVASHAKGLRLTRSLNWYLLTVVMFFLYGESLGYYLAHVA